MYVDVCLHSSLLLGWLSPSKNGFYNLTQRYTCILNMESIKKSLCNIFTNKYKYTYVHGERVGQIIMKKYCMYVHVCYVGYYTYVYM